MTLNGWYYVYYNLDYPFISRNNIIDFVKFEDDLRDVNDYITSAYRTGKMDEIPYAGE